MKEICGTVTNKERKREVDRRVTPDMNSEITVGIMRKI